MIYFSFHTHTTYCDGKNSAEEFVLHAIGLGLKSIGFSSHAPLPQKESWSMLESDLEAYVKEIKLLKEFYKDDIEIYLSLEIDYIPGVTKSFEEFKRIGELDYTIGSVHLVKTDVESKYWFLDGPDTNYSSGIEKYFNNDAQKAITAYFDQLIEMVETQKPDVIGHADKVKMNNKNRFFLESDSWYLSLIDKSIRSIKASGSIIEINTRGIYKKKSDSFFPDGYFLSECRKHNIPITISSDAHQLKELISEFDNAVEYVKKLGFDSIRIFENGKWIDQVI